MTILDIYTKAYLLKVEQFYYVSCFDTILMTFCDYPNHYNILAGLA